MFSWLRLWFTQNAFISKRQPLKQEASVDVSVVGGCWQLSGAEAQEQDDKTQDWRCSNNEVFIRKVNKMHDNKAFVLLQSLQGAQRLNANRLMWNVSDMRVFHSVWNHMHCTLCWTIIGETQQQSALPSFDINKQLTHISSVSRVLTSVLVYSSCKDPQCFIFMAAHTHALHAGCETVRVMPFLEFIAGSISGKNTSICGRDSEFSCFCGIIV